MKVKKTAKVNTGMIIGAVILGLFIIGGLFLGGSSEDEVREGEAKVPSSYDTLIEMDYESVQEKFEDSGFTNIKLEPMEDLITGWLTEDGDVESVTIDGSTEFTSGDWYPNDVEVVIQYHTFPPEEEDDSTDDTGDANVEDKDEEEEVEQEHLTVENCSDLKNILSKKDNIDDSYADFVFEYSGRIIEFDGRIDYCTRHGNYTTRFDYLVSAGDYDPDHQIGPSFKFEDVTWSDLHTNIDTVSVGLNVRIAAKVLYYDEDSGLFYLEPVSITLR